MASRKEEIEALLVPLRKELGDIEQEERLEAGCAMVGRCFKYRNSYGGSNPNERWWMYGVIVKMGAGSYWPEAFCFQHDKQGKWEIEQRAFSGQFGDGYREISYPEFIKAWDAFCAGMPKVPSYSQLVRVPK